MIICLFALIDILNTSDSHTLTLLATLDDSVVTSGASNLVRIFRLPRKIQDETSISIYERTTTNSLLYKKLLEVLIDQRGAHSQLYPIKTFLVVSVKTLSKSFLQHHSWMQSQQLRVELACPTRKLRGFPKTS